MSEARLTPDQRQFVAVQPNYYREYCLNLKRKTPKQEFFFKLARLRAHPLIRIPSGAHHKPLKRASNEDEL